MESKPDASSSWDVIKSEYKLIENVGEGSYGEVFKAIHIKSKFRVAIKKVALPENAGITVYNSVIREIAILRKLSKHASNRFTVRLVDVIVSDKEMEDNKIKNIFMVMDFWEFSLRNMLNTDITNYSEEHL